jgi:hypothetical protein
MGTIFNRSYNTSKHIINTTKQYFILLLFLIILFNTLYHSTIALSLDEDYFDARPTVQIPEKYVNISYVPSDPSQIKIVQAIIGYPNGDLKTKNMTLNNGKYVYNHVYESIGKYIFHISVEDKSGNTHYTTKKTFWITPDINDTDNDGMPDRWEDKYSLNRFNPTDADNDDDEDGYTNIEEYNTSTNPFKKTSFAEVTINKLETNQEYFATSCFLFTILAVLSLYGIRRRKTICE